MVIPERDHCRLTMRSKLPGAERFEEWVVSEVLPAIRKTGSYGAAPVPEVDVRNAAHLGAGPPPAPGPD